MFSTSRTVNFSLGSAGLTNMIIDYLIGGLVGASVALIGLRLLYLDHVYSSIRKLRGGVEWTDKNMSWKDLFSFRTNYFEQFVVSYIDNDNK